MTCTCTNKGHVLFVCSGNTCRSPMAEAFANHYIGEEGLDHIFFATSAGTAVWKRLPAAVPAVCVMKEYGLDISRHKAKSVEDVFIPDTFLILGMTKDHVDLLKCLFPEKASSIFRFTDYVFPEESSCGDIPDPYGLDLEAYRYVAGMLDRLARGLVKRLSKERDSFQTR